MSNPKVLVACPTASVKDYAFEHYYNAYRSFDYPEKNLFIVDNSDDGGRYAETLVHRLSLHNVHHIEPLENLYDTIDLSWQYILRQARRYEYDYIMSLESDIIAPPNAVSVMVDLIQKNNACMVRHSYPLRAGGYICCLGCLIMETTLVPQMWNMADRVDPQFGDSYHEERRFMHVALETGRPVLDVHNFFDLVHLDDGASKAFRIAAGTGHGHEKPKRHTTRVKLNGIDGSAS